jgi:hypothetical protein
VPNRYYQLRGIRWLDTRRFVAFSDSRATVLCSVDGGPPEPYYQDSTWTEPFLAVKQALSLDSRAGHQGMWRVPLDAKGNPAGAAVKIPWIDRRRIIASPDGRRLIFANDSGEWWKVVLPSGTEERIANRPPLANAFYGKFGNDGRLAYLVDRVTLKLILLEDVFQ